MGGELLTVWTIRLALAGYFLGLGILLLAKDRPAFFKSARWVWTAACLLYLVHVASAFHYFYAWSHASAVAETAREAKEVVGVEASYGIYMNHVFTLLWLLDVVWWWSTKPVSYTARSKLITVSIHLYMLFMVVNGALIFEQGPVRWFSLVAFLGLCALWLYIKFSAQARIAGPLEKYG